MADEIVEKMEKLTISPEYPASVIVPTYADGKFQLALTMREINYISAALDAKYRTMVNGRKKSASERAARAASVPEGSKPRGSRQVAFYAVTINPVN